MTFLKHRRDRLLAPIPVRYLLCVPCATDSYREGCSAYRRLGNQRRLRSHPCQVLLARSRQRGVAEHTQAILRSVHEWRSEGSHSTIRKRCACGVVGCGGYVKLCSRRAYVATGQAVPELGNLLLLQLQYVCRHLRPQLQKLLAQRAAAE
jgi:hypothetical protein